MRISSEPLRQRAFCCAEIWLQNSDGSEARKLAVPLPQPASGGKLSPDGKQLLFSMSATPEQDYSYTTTLFLADVDSAQPAVPLPTAGLPPNTIDAASWSSSGDAIIVDAVCGVRHVLYRLDLASQTWAPLTDPTADVSFGGWSYSAGTDTHVVSAVSQQNGGDIHLVNVDQSLTQLTHVFDDLTAKYALPEVRAIQWSGEDGETIEGLLYHPIGRKEGDEPAPLVVST